MITYYLYDLDGYFIDSVQIDMKLAAPPLSTLQAPPEGLVKPRRVNLEWVEGVVPA